MNGNLFEPAAPAAASDWVVAHCDGGSRGNPGPAGFGAIVEDAGGTALVRLSEFLGIQTNNFAEYSGMLAVLRWALDNGRKHVRVISDSELMVKQMQGKYKVSSPAIRPLWEEAKKMTRQLEGFEIRHTLRAGNKTADRLANEAMDRGMGRNPAASSARPAADGLRAPAARPYGKLESTPRPIPTPCPAVTPSAKPTALPARQSFEGYVKNGVVHLLGGELPENAFVTVVYEPKTRS